jgi:hypothetical protein
MNRSADVLGKFFAIMPAQQAIASGDVGNWVVKP